MEHIVSFYGVRMFPAPSAPRGSVHLSPIPPMDVAGAMATCPASMLPAAREVQLASQELQLTEEEVTQRFSKGLPPGRQRENHESSGEK